MFDSITNLINIVYTVGHDFSYCCLSHMNLLYILIAALHDILNKIIVSVALYQFLLVLVVNVHHSFGCKCTPYTTALYTLVGIYTCLNTIDTISYNMVTCIQTCALYICAHLYPCVNWTGVDMCKEVNTL